MTDLAQHRAEATGPSAEGQPPPHRTGGSGPVAPRAEPTGLVRPRAKRRRTHSRQISLLIRSGLPVTMFLLWWLLTGTGVLDGDKVPSPRSTWDAFTVLLVHGDLMGDVGVSVARMLVGLAIGATVGLVLGVVVGLFTWGEEIIDSTMQMLRVVPVPAIIFLFIIWVGIGETSKVALIALACVFPMYLNAFNGVRNVDRRVVEAARAFGVRGVGLVRQVVMPLAMPSILTGLRFAGGISIVALVFAETINASKGIGYLVAQASSFDQVGNLFVCIFVYALLGILVDLAVRLGERFLMPWRRHVSVR